MEITEVEVRIVNGKDRLKGFAKIVLDDCFVIDNINLIAREDSMFVAMPSRKTGDGSYRDVAYPIKRAVQMDMEKKILDAYINELKASCG